MSGLVEQRLQELGITLPEAPPAVAAYVPWVQTGQLVVTSGQLPFVDGEMAYAGRVGGELDDEQGYQAARVCAINALAQLKDCLGDLDRIEQIVRLERAFGSRPPGSATGSQRRFGVVGRGVRRCGSAHADGPGDQRDAPGRCGAALGLGIGVLTSPAETTTADDSMRVVRCCC